MQIEVVRPKLFAQSFAKWAASRHWRDLFAYENSDFLFSSIFPTEPSSTLPGQRLETCPRLPLGKSNSFGQIGDAPSKFPIILQLFVLHFFAFKFLI
jgi:hypothetical protein